jgi:hypothetical protein
VNYDNEPEVYDRAALWIFGFLIAAAITYALYKSAGN